MIETALWGGSLRCVQALVLAAPTILVSLFVTGLLARLFGPKLTRQLYGGSGWRSLVQSWTLGMLLPGCSLGVIPISRELCRAGLGGSAVLAFALTQPLFDPLSVLYGLTLGKPLIVFAFAGCSLVLVMVVGSLWDRLHPDSPALEPMPVPVQAGWPRLLSILLVVLREAAGPTMVYVGIGLMGTALLGALLPFGALSRAMNGGNPWAPWTMTWVAIPAYATPTLAMSQLGSMFQHANSAGAALQLLTLGAGLNLGLLAWILATYGWRRTLTWMGLLLVASLSMAYALDRPLHPRDVEPADHTHAFDIYCCPFHANETHLAPLAQQRFREALALPQVIPVGILGALMLLGAVLQVVDPQHRLEKWLEVAEVSRAASRYDVHIPAPVVGGLLLIGVVAMSIVGCFAYYPHKHEVFQEMQMVRAEALLAANLMDARKAAHYIQLWDAWTRRLEVGVFLREWHLTPYQKIKAKILRDKLELLRHEVESDDHEATKIMIRQVNDAYVRLQKAFNPPTPPLLSRDE